MSVVSKGSECVFFKLFCFCESNVWVVNWGGEGVCVFVSCWICFSSMKSRF